MKSILKTQLIVGVASVALSLLAFCSQAEAGGVKVGVLNCRVDAGWGFVIGSSKDLRCIYSPVRGPEEHYLGTVTKFGLDVGYTRGGVLIWEVVAPHVDDGQGALQGGYGGATASASVGIGVGGHALIGGFHRSITLQPLSISGETGLNVAAGVASIQLRHVR